MEPIDTTREARLAFDALRELAGKTEVGCAVIVVPHDGSRGPYVSAKANVSDIAAMARAMVDMVASWGRPGDCVVCMAKYDALMRARQALEAVEGRC
ncbi:MAG: hypothetical protein ACREEW_06260 [Caulobacteraceae bacterium]